MALAREAGDDHDAAVQLNYLCFLAWIVAGSGDGRAARPGRRSLGCASSVTRRA